MSEFRALTIAAIGLAAAMAGTALWVPGAEWQKLLSLALMFGGSITVGSLVRDLARKNEI